ncbi:preprotein translocase subunit SecG [Aureimonas sp. AU40]|uniref:preprotein translocase subunit SecG n=1 Tax=Aureimonas sp. AU40 TaxID=1637747 RepID=UPI000782DDD9|nr:preprotein translocase subunit SecG [Aureimonas sp. AU40]
MQTVLIAVHLLIVLALVVVVLLQRSEGGGLGMGGGSGGGLMTARGAANMLTRTTAILATLFFITSMALAILARYGTDPLDILNRVPASQGAPATGTGANGSLLDQLGGLPEQTPATTTTNGVPAGGSATTGATPVAPVTPAPAQNESGVPTGAAPATIPANPAPQAPNAGSQPTVAPVESPAPGAADNGAPNASPAQPAQ